MVQQHEWLVAEVGVRTPGEEGLFGADFDHARPGEQPPQPSCAQVRRQHLEDGVQQDGEARPGREDEDTHVSPEDDECGHVRVVGHVGATNYIDNDARESPDGSAQDQEQRQRLT
jgi:hypothetical protein